MRAAFGASPGSNVFHPRRTAALATVLVGLGACGDGLLPDAGGDGPPRDFTLPFPEEDMTGSGGPCMNQVKDNDESDVDCGGGLCKACDDGKMCNGGRDCLSGACANKQCQPPSCMDIIKNGTESDVDCGASCPMKCENGQLCNDGPDCKSALCLNGKCQMSPCQDKMQNGMETDVDCGGPMCPKCVNGQKCGGAMDCVSGRCMSGTCRPPQGMVDFAKPVNYPLEGTGYVTTGDFDEDGLMDLVVLADALMGRAQFSVFKAVGNGTFAKPPKTYNSGLMKAGPLVATDFSGDGHLDLVASYIGLKGTIGNGDGTFQDTLFGGDAAWGMQANARYVVAGKFNGDSKTDFVEGTPGATPTFIHLSNQQWPWNQDPLMQTATTGAVVADLDADGALDLALTTAKVVSVQKGDGVGQFKEVVALAPGTTPNDLVAADFNGDGKLDLAVANEGSNDASVFVGQGGANFGGLMPMMVGRSPAFTAVGDFNFDKKKDLLFVTMDMNNNRNTVTILLGMGDGRFQAPMVFPMGGTTGGSVVVADFNQDGYSDVAFVQWSPMKALTVMLNLAN